MPYTSIEALVRTVGTRGAGMQIRLTRKLADFIDGIDLSHHTVGQLIDLPQEDAQRIVAEGWAEFIADAAASNSRSEAADRRQRSPKT